MGKITDYLPKAFLVVGGMCLFLTAFGANKINVCSSEQTVSVAKTYHLDAVSGSDSNDGLTAETAWKTIRKIRTTTFQPGDSILFKRGTTYKGRLEISAQGNEAQPIVFGAYGSASELPQFTALDNSRYAVRIYNSNYVTLENMEIINHGSQEMPGRTGVKVECRDFGVSRGIRLNNLLVRDVNGTIVKKNGGGSGILISNTNSEGGKISTFDGLTIEYCHIKNCYRNAMIWEGCWDRTNWYANKNVLVRYNLIEEVPGDGIVPIGCDGAVVEYNVMRNGTAMFDPNSRTEAAAGIWPWSCDNTIIRFNEVSGHKAPWDGQGFDADYNCTNTIIEYNYSHDNWGGMVLVCAAGDEKKYDYCWGNENPVVRYNISIGDGNRPHQARGKMFSPSIHIGGPVEGLQLYRNIVHNKKKAAENIDRSMLVSDDWVGCAVNTTIKENIFYAPEESNFDFTHSKNNKVEGNYYLGLYKNIPSQEAGLPMPEKYEKMVTDNGNDGLMQMMDSVTIAGGEKCVFVNKEKVEAFFEDLVPDPKFAAFATPYYWAEGAVGALPKAETEQLLAKKSVEEARAYVASVADKVVQWDDTQYYRMKNYVRDLAQGNGKRQGQTGFMGNVAHVDWTKEIAEVSCHGADMGDAGVVWAFEKEGNTNKYKIKNLNNGLYLASTDAKSASKYLKFTDRAKAGTYSLQALNGVLAQYHISCTTGNGARNQLHASGAGVMNYNTGANDASSWYLVPATEFEVALEKLDEDYYASLHLPFNVSCDDTSLNFYGVKAVDAEKAAAVAEEMDGLIAGQGAILKGAQKKYSLVINGGAVAPNFENLLNGTDEVQESDGVQSYFLLGKNAEGRVGLYSGSIGEVRNQAFLALPEGPADGFMIQWGEPTGIGNLTLPKENGKAVYFDLSGRRVMTPSNGIYIKNGKKVYIK